MNHSSILVNQAYFYDRFISTINDYVKNDLEFCSSLLVHEHNRMQCCSLPDVSCDSFIKLLIKLLLELMKI